MELIYNQSFYFINSTTFPNQFQTALCEIASPTVVTINWRYGHIDNYGVSIIKGIQLVDTHKMVLNQTRQFFHDFFTQHGNRFFDTPS